VRIVRCGLFHAALWSRERQRKKNKVVERGLVGGCGGGGGGGWGLVGGGGRRGKGKKLELLEEDLSCASFSGLIKRGKTRRNSARQAKPFRAQQ